MDIQVKYLKEKKHLSRQICYLQRKKKKNVPEGNKGISIKF